jgi:hypothetical protein
MGDGLDKLHVSKHSIGVKIAKNSWGWFYRSHESHISQSLVCVLRVATFVEGIGCAFMPFTLSLIAAHL